MKKFFKFFLAAVFSVSAALTASAIENPDPIGSMTVGVHGAYYPGFGGNVFGDYVLVDSWWKGHFTVGGQAAVNIYKNNPGYGLTVSDTRICLVPRATYGLNINERFEVHAGLLLGLGYEKGRISDGSATLKAGEDGLRLVYGEILGARYFFTDNFGVSAEFNYATYMPYLNVGVALRF